MGDLIYLDERRADRSRANCDTRPSFFFDLGCPLSYLPTERVERALGDVEWVPVAARSLRAEPGEPETDVLRQRAEACARALRLPLVWPDRFPADAPCALRAAVHAAEIGAGARFALAASRLAFCGGFDLEDPETLAEAAAAAGVPLDACLDSTGDCGRDDRLLATAEGLRSRGVGELPAIRVASRWLQGESALLAASAMLRRPEFDERPLAPVG
jgi:2-hydroxychromene-2-carboxylate isomerase